MAGQPHPEWRTADIVRTMSVRAGRGLEAAGKVLATAMVAELSTPGPAPSQPGEAPHKQSGDLVGAVDVQRVSDTVVRVGVVDPDQHPKAVRLARGFKGTDSLGRRYNQRPRPYAVPAMRRMNNRLVADFTRGAR